MSRVRIWAGLADTIELLTGSISTKQNLSVKVAACVSLMALGAISCGKRSFASRWYVTVDRLLGPIRSPYKPIETRKLRYQAHESNPVGT